MISNRSRRQTHITSHRSSLYLWTFNSGDVIPEVLSATFWVTSKLALLNLSAPRASCAFDLQRAENSFIKKLRSDRNYSTVSFTHRSRLCSFVCFAGLIYATCVDAENGGWKSAWSAFCETSFRDGCWRWMNFIFFLLFMLPTLLVFFKSPRISCCCLRHLILTQIYLHPFQK